MRSALLLTILGLASAEWCSDSAWTDDDSCGTQYYKHYYRAGHPSGDNYDCGEGVSCVKADCCRNQMCGDNGHDNRGSNTSPFRTDLHCYNNDVDTFYIKDDTHLCAAEDCVAADCCAVQTCALSAWTNDSECQDPTNGYYKDDDSHPAWTGGIAGTYYVSDAIKCPQLLCEQENCCASQSCADSEYNSDQACYDATSSILPYYVGDNHGDEKCSSYQCSTTECCTGTQNQKCSESAWTNDATCGDDWYRGDDETCPGAECAKIDCCHPMVFWQQSNVNPCRKAYTGNEIVCEDSYRSKCRHSHVNPSGYTCDWSVCQDGDHGDRMFCPAFAPFMCRDKDCGGADWCCEADINQCRDGLRETCPGAPSINPTKAPTLDPTVYPTKNPTTNPTEHPTVCPTTNPTEHPTLAPTPPICGEPGHRLMFKLGFTELSICPTTMDGVHKCELCFKAESLTEKVNKGFVLDGSTKGGVKYSFPGTGRFTNSGHNNP